MDDHDDYREWSRAGDDWCLLVILARSTGEDYIEVLCFHVRAAWDSFGDLWLPVATEAYEPQELSILQLTFEWSDVNEPIPAAEFAIENSGIPRGTLIADRRLSPDDPVVLGKVGVEQYALHRPNPKAPLTPRSPASTWTYALYGVNAIVFAGIAVLYVVKRRRSA